MILLCFLCFSVRVFSRRTHKNLSTVLPPPSLSPFQQAQWVTYNRLYSVAYVLTNTREIYVYTTRYVVQWVTYTTRFQWVTYNLKVLPCGLTLFSTFFFVVSHGTSTTALCISSPNTFVKTDYFLATRFRSVQMLEELKTNTLVLVTGKNCKSQIEDCWFWIS